MITLMLVIQTFTILLDILLSYFNNKIGKLFLIILIASSVFVTTFTATFVTVNNLSVSTALLFIIVIFRIINLLRVAQRRMHSLELRARATNTAVVLGLLSLVSVLIIHFKYLPNLNIYQLAYINVFLAMMIALSVIIGRSKYRFQKKDFSNDLPTVSVCIPARNETKDLPVCLESVLSSDYRKLEVLVLDDCSHDKTPATIKKYAHAGVRFINGKEPSTDWLAKNAAYDRLADEATGEILLFIGVDVQLGVSSISDLIAQMEGIEMLSVLPQRNNSHETSFFIQPLRYWWELGLWRFGFRHKPVLSSCWMIRSETLKKLGFFESVKKTISPEVIFSRILDRAKMYNFIIAKEPLGVISNKSPQDQYYSAVRKRYPQVGRAPELLLLVILIEALIVIGPHATLFWAIINSDSFILLLSMSSIVLLSVANAIIYKLVLKLLWPVGFISISLLVLADWFLLIKSLYEYEFGKVIWKERNICIPLFTVEKNLPKL